MAPTADAPTTSKQHDVTAGHPEEEAAWFRSKDFQRTTLRFHDRHARYPEEAIKEARYKLNKTIQGLYTRLSKELHFISRVEYTGSVYEGVKIPSKELEFDLMVILAGFDQQLVHRAIHWKPGFFTLAANKGQSPRLLPYMGSKKSGTPGHWYLMPQKVLSKLHSYIVRCLKENPAEFRDVTLRPHGPAIQLDVCRPGSAELWFTVDVVPTVEISPVLRFVAKPYKTEEEDDMADVAWRISYSLQEKAMLRGIDEGNQCRKQCLRVLKAIRDREPTLRYIPSFMLKTLLIRNRHQGSWMQPDLGRRVLDMLSQLAECLEKGNLRHFYDTEMNILGNLLSDSMLQSARRIRELLRSGAKFRKLVDGQ